MKEEKKALLSLWCKLYTVVLLSRIINMSLDLDILLNIPGASVEICSYQNDEVYLTLRLLTDDCACPHCQRYTEDIHQNRPILIRDLPVFGKKVYLKIPRRQFYCANCQRYFTERLDFVAWERRYTRRYEEYIYQRIQSASMEQIGREEDLSFSQIQGIFNHQNDQKKTGSWGTVRRLSIDEISQRKGHKDFVTVVADIDQGKLIEMIDSHKQENIIEILIQQPLSVREQVEEVSVDMWGGFPKVVQEVFPNAKIVIDRFHVMKLVNTELDQIRRQVRITDQGVRFILLKNRADLSEQEEVKLTAILAHSKRLSIAYHLKEEFRNIYELSATVEEGKEKFKQWLLKAQSIYGKVVQTIRTHLLEICNYFINRTTSGVMEGINNRIKLIKRQAYGFLRFDNFRARTLAGFSD